MIVRALNRIQREFNVPNYFSSVVNRHKKYNPIDEFMTIAKKRNINQSPLKIKFLLSLVHNTWYPDALAQLKFSPKHRAVDISKIVKRAGALAKLYHGFIPEELIVKEAVVTKGSMRKKIRIMGRGRTGIGYKRKSHVTIKVTRVNFDEMIKKARNVTIQNTWKIRKEMVDKIKAKNIAP